VRAFRFPKLSQRPLFLEFELQGVPKLPKPRLPRPSVGPAASVYISEGNVAQRCLLEVHILLIFSFEPRIPLLFFSILEASGNQPNQPSSALGRAGFRAMISETAEMCHQFSFSVVFS
jgi:hypothetical protein